jgi:hypothetical protein
MDKVAALYIGNTIGMQKNQQVIHWPTKKVMRKN